ncbi:MAG: acyltransferase family protein [Caulobacterales bacterium]
MQVLRGLAAVLVATFHAFQWLDDRFWIGASGVDVFFVISGFIIWTVTAGRKVNPAAFLWRRITRVAPAYWVMTGVVALIAAFWPMFLPQVALSPRHVLLSLAFIQHTDPHGLVFPVLPPGWTLNYEAIFYVTFAAVLFAPGRLRFPLVIAALFGVCAFGFMNPPAYGLAANPMMLQFAAGVWLGRRHVLRRRIEPGAGLIFALIGVGLMTIMYLTHFRSELFRPLLWGFPAVMIVGGAVALEEGGAFRAPRALVRLGDASYAIYLCHMPACALVAHTMGTRPVALFVPTAILVSTAAGFAFHFLIEQPLIAAFRSVPERIAAVRLARSARPG